MNSRNNGKHDPFGWYIRQNMKKWLEQQTPPVDARERLMLAASMDSFWKNLLHRLWQYFNHRLIPSMALELSFEKRVHTQFSYSDPYLQLENAHTYGWGAYQMMFRSIPVGLGLLRFLN